MTPVDEATFKIGLDAAIIDEAARLKAENERLRTIETAAKEWAAAYSGNDHIRLGNAEIMLHGVVQQLVGGQRWMNVGTLA